MFPLATTATLARQTGSRAPLIAFAGDSITFATAGSNDTLIKMVRNRGLQFWVPFLTNKRVKSPPEMNFGVNSDTSTMLLARIGPILASGADYLVVEIGTNDYLAGLSYATTIANYQTIWRMAMDAGMHVIALPVTPRDIADATHRAHHFRLMRYVENQRFAGSKNFTVISTASYFIDPTSATGAMKTGYSGDGLHPKSRGDYYRAVPIAAWFNSLYPAGASPFTSIADVYSATNLSGNLLTNGLLDGTGGTSTGSAGTVAGSFADSFNINHVTAGGTLTGLTSTGSKITHPDGSPGQRIAFTGSYTGATAGTINSNTLCIFQQSLASFGTAPVAGDTVRASCEISKAAAATENLVGIELQINPTISGATHRRADGSSLGDPLPVVAFSGTLETPPITLSANPSAFVCGVRFYFNTGAQTAGSTVDIFKLRLEKVS